MRRDVPQRRGGRGGRLERAQRLGAPPASPSSSAPGTRPLKIRSPCASPARSPAPSTSAVSAGSVNRRGVPAAPSASSSWRASVNRPARARCRTAATAFAASTLTVAAGRSTAAIAVIASAGESTYSSTLWQMTRSPPSGRPRCPGWPPHPAPRQPRARLGGPPLRRRERVRARVDHGDVVPQGGERHRQPAGPPAHVDDVQRRPPVSAARAETTSRSTSQTREKRTPLRLKSAATPASFQESNLVPHTGGVPLPATPGRRAGTLRCGG